MDLTALVTDRSAWKGAEFRENDSWIRALSLSEVDELAHAARRCIARRLPLTEIRREDFSLETLTRTISGWADEINTGRGFLLVRGLPADLDDETVRTIFWGIGLYLGVPISQNSYGDMLGDVYDQGLKMATGRVRGYQTNQRLMFHTDRCDMVGLLCLRPAKSGGLSSIVSSTRIYNEIATHHPAYLEPLFAGYIHVNLEEGGDLSTYRMPVYSIHDGVVSCRIMRNTVENARKMGHAQWSAIEAAALECLDTLANREDMRLDMILERGDMQLINNYTTLHARTAFEDYPEADRRRHMVRLWLKSFPPRRPHDFVLFKDYDGIEKSLERTRGAGLQV